ncbi:hypothetical protein VB620_17645 [Nodularia harveyana UHCC-0300]|uniref:Uncharacterized protein n=1 Tax=Nodularia harveyana UHCC-0300 TaxID=2974287 RepID=A0ABU5UIP5_9CYAN|nr:hypothetical protein [Nodularia harveyana]MEA5583158.1 hypothetical protein [Nodularia harveyana UHCC-0300]
MNYQQSTAMNNFPLYQPTLLSENSNPFIHVVPISPLPPRPGIPSNFTPPKLVLDQSSALMI